MDGLHTTLGLIQYGNMFSTMRAFITYNNRLSAVMDGLHKYGRFTYHNMLSTVMGGLHTLIGLVQ